MKPYYRVFRCYTYSSNNYRVTSVLRYETLAEAQEEAERLAMEEKGVTFEILECVAISRVDEPAITFYMDGKSPDNF